jgi:hypothetical protein
MAKSTRKNTKRTISAKKTKKTVIRRKKADELISSLLELHKLQGVLLTQLRKEI